jgi:Tfp pilus assembly protein FimT
MKLKKASTGVWSREYCKGWAADRFRSAAGFTLAEASIALLIGVILTTFALFNMGGILPGMRANKGMYETVAQLRRGRNLAIAQRRNIRLQFFGTNEINLTRIDEPTGTTDMGTIPLDGGCQFLKFSQITTDTPDQLTPQYAVDFGGAATLTFTTDGTLVDQNGDPANGTIFVGLTDHPEAARAITILGATGRVRSYRWNGTTWIQ